MTEDDSNSLFDDSGEVVKQPRTDGPTSGPATISEGPAGVPVSDEPTVTKLLILVKDANRVRSTVTFLEKREVPAQIVTSMNDAIAILSKKEANLVLLSVNFPHPKVEVLPGLLQTSFSLECIVFAESEDRKTTQKIQAMKPKWQILGPVSGPAVLMKIKQMAKKQEELANASNESAAKKASGEKEEAGDIKISGRNKGNETQVLRNSVIKSSTDTNDPVNRIRSGGAGESDISISGSGDGDSGAIKLRGNKSAGDDRNGRSSNRDDEDDTQVNRLRNLPDDDQDSSNRMSSKSDDDDDVDRDSKPKSIADELADMLGESALHDEDEAEKLTAPQLNVNDLEAETSGRKAADQETMVQKGHRAQLHENEQEGNVGELNSAEQEGNGAGLPHLSMPDPDDIGDDSALASEFSDNTYDDLPQQAAEAPTAYGPLSGQTGAPDDLPDASEIGKPTMHQPEDEMPGPVQEETPLPQMSAADIEPQEQDEEEARPPELKMDDLVNEDTDPTQDQEQEAAEDSMEAPVSINEVDEDIARDAAGNEVELNESQNIIWEACRRSLADVLGQGAITLEACRKIERVGIVIVESKDVRSTFLLSTIGAPQKAIAEILQPLSGRLRVHLETFKISVGEKEMQAFELDSVSFDVKHMVAGEFSITMASSVLEASLTHLNVSGFVPHFGAIHEDMTFVEIEHFPAEVRLDVDVFVHLPLNQKFVRYWKQNSVVSEKQVEKMRSFKVEKLLVKTVDVEKFKVFCIKNAVVQIANAEIEKKSLAA